MKIAQLPQVRRKQNIILAILLLALPLLVFAVYQVVELRSRASGDIEPKNIIVSDLTTSLITISWTTEKASIGSVVILENGVEKKTYKDSRDISSTRKKNTHYVQLTDLSPNTQYKFLITSDSKKYTSVGGKELSFKTAPMKEGLPVVNPAGGEIATASDSDVVVYVLLSDKSTYPVSSVLSSTKSWHLDLSSLLNISNKERVKLGEGTGLTILATDGRGKGATLTGTYSSLFDSSGILKSSHKIQLEEGKDIYASIPNQAKLAISVPDEGKCWYFDGICKETTENCSGSGRYLTKELCESANSDDPDDPYDPRENDPDPDKPYVPGIRPPSGNEGENPSDDIEFTNRQYRIIEHLRWTDLTNAPRFGVSGNTGASSIKVTNITDTGFTVIWVSEQKEEGSVKYGTSPTQLGSVAADSRDGFGAKSKNYLHNVNVSSLQPKTKYFYNVISGSDTYNNGGNGFSVETHSTIEGSGRVFSVAGELTGMPEHKEVILLGKIKDGDDTGSKGESSTISTIVGEDSSWILPVAEMREGDGSKYFEHTAGDTLLIDPYTTFNSAQQKVSMEGIDTKDVTIGLEESTSSDPIETESVPRLKDYGITGSAQYVVPSSNPQSSVPQQNSLTVESGEIPKTGLLDSFVGILLVSISLIGSGTVVFLSIRNKEKKDGKMVKGL